MLDTILTLFGVWLITSRINMLAEANRLSEPVREH